MPIQNKYSQLGKKLNELSQLESVLGLLHWDQEVLMPKKSAESRGEQIETLALIHHQKSTDASLGTLILECLENSDLDLWQRANVKEAKRAWDKTNRIPVDLATALAKQEVVSHQAWIAAREENSFAIFQNCFVETLNLARQQAQVLVEEGQSEYDALLDLYEPNMKAQQVKAVFDPLKIFLGDLLTKIKESPFYQKGNLLPTALLIEEQKQLGQKVMQQMGFDFQRGRLDVSVHPFCGGPGPDDVRVTTRYDEQNFISSLMGMMHEAGHALYEQGRPKKYRGQPVSEARSMAFHESQSLLWEKQVGQSRAFSQLLLDSLQERYAKNYQSVSVEDLYLKLNQVEQSFIRVDADEVTYPLHIMLRFDLEQALISGDLKVPDLEAAWNDKMQAYLRIIPDSPNQGVLQDIHWPTGSFGYFPTYTLGAMYAAQFFDSAKKKILNLEDLVQEGNFVSLKNFLNEQIHSKASSAPADQICSEVTGEALNPKYFMSYLEEKYSVIYSRNVD